MGLLIRLAIDSPVDASWKTLPAFFGSEAQIDFARCFYICPILAIQPENWLSYNF